MEKNKYRLYILDKQFCQVLTTWIESMLNIFENIPSSSKDSLENFAQAYSLLRLVVVANSKESAKRILLSYLRFYSVDETLIKFFLDNPVSLLNDEKFDTIDDVVDCYNALAKMTPKSCRMLYVNDVPPNTKYNNFFRKLK